MSGKSGKWWSWLRDWLGSWRRAPRLQPPPQCRDFTEWHDMTDYDREYAAGFRLALYRRLERMARGGEIDDPEVYASVMHTCEQIRRYQREQRRQQRALERPQPERQVSPRQTEAEPQPVAAAGRRARRSQMPPGPRG